MCFICANHNIIHGDNYEKLYAALNITMPERVIDFSTNTNIISWPKINLDVERLASSYPDYECSRLVKIISEHENISQSRILFTNGINEAIYLLANLLASQSVGILQPCYSEYMRAFSQAQSVFNLDEAGRFKNFIIVNPNNPTGIYINNLSELIKTCPDTRFIIDEAYIDFLIKASRERLCELDNVIILRSLTKIFHLSGVRIGYVIANESIIENLRKLQPTWSVNSIAQELALYFLNDSDFYNRTQEFYKSEAPGFMQSLRDSGFEVMNSSVHYFLLRVHDDYELIKYLLEKGLVVRHTRNFAGLDGKYIRVATRRHDENKLLQEALTIFS